MRLLWTIYIVKVTVLVFGCTHTFSSIIFL